jgi:predicted metal-dependent phosphoesterase TrpH
MCTVPLLRRVCRESYNQPMAVYEKLKRLGMDLVTITDHDSIDAAEELRSRPDFFLSEEVTCRLPSGTELHMGVYDITERDHVELQRRRDDFESADCLAARAQSAVQRQPHILQPHRTPLAGRFRTVRARLPRARNAQRPHAGARQRERRRAGRFRAKAEVGGSDAHAMASVGCAWTVVPRARTREEYLDGLRRGQGACGAPPAVTGS